MCSSIYRGENPLIGHLLHRRFGYSPRTARAQFAALNELGLKNHAYSLWLDFGFMALYGGTFCLVWALSGRPGAEVFGVSWLLLLAGAALFADVVENGILLAGIARFRRNGTVKNLAIRVASLATIAKLVCLIFAVTVLELEVVGIVAWFRDLFS